MHSGTTASILPSLLKSTQSVQKFSFELSLITKEPGGRLAQFLQLFEFVFAALQTVDASIKLDLCRNTSGCYVAVASKRGRHAFTVLLDTDCKPKVMATGAMPMHKGPAALHMESCV
jgi:hypothetical protein